MKSFIILNFLATAFLACAVQSRAETYLSYNYNGDPSSTFATNLGTLGSGMDGNYFGLGGQNPTTQGTFPGVSGLPGDYAWENNSAVFGDDGFGGRVGFDQSTTYFPSTVSSFTLSFWLNPVTTQTAGARIVQTAPENFDVIYAGGGRLLFYINTTEAHFADGYILDDVANQNKWTFYSITYDGTLTTDNLLYYRGDTTTPAALYATNTLDAGVWSPTQAGESEFYFGNNYGGIRSVVGALDNTQFDGASSGSGGALDLATIEAIRFAATIPEPSTIALLGLVGLSAIAYRAKRMVCSR